MSTYATHMPSHSISCKRQFICTSTIVRWVVGLPGCGYKISWIVSLKLMCSKEIVATSDAGYLVPNIFCACGSIIDFLANSYFILKIYHAKSF